MIDRNIDGDGFESSPRTRAVSALAGVALLAISVLGQGSSCTIGEVSASIPIANANRLALTSEGSRLYVLGQLPMAPGCHTDVFVVDTATNSIITSLTTSLMLGGNIQSMAVRPDDLELWIPRGDICGATMTGTDSRIEIIDVVSNVQSTILVGNSDFGLGEIVFSPDSSTAFVAHHGDRLLRVYDTATRNQTATVSFGAAEVIGLAITPDGSELYGVAGVPTPVVYAIDTTNIGAAPVPIAITPTPAATGTHAVASLDGKRIYCGFSATPGMSTDIHVIDSDPMSPMFHQEIDIISIPLGASTNDLGLNSTGDRLLVTRNQANVLYSIDIELGSPTFHQIESTVALPSTVVDVVGLGASTAAAYVSSSDTGVVSVIGEPYPGSGEDLVLSTDVTPFGTPGVPTPCPSIKPANGGEIITMVLDSLMGTLDFAVPILLGQLFTTGQPPASPGGFPEVAVDITACPLPFVIFDGAKCPFSPCYLPPQGLAIVGTAPLFLSGLSIMIQGYSITNTAANTFFASTNGHEIRLL